MTQLPWYGFTGTIVHLLNPQ